MVAYQSSGTMVGGTAPYEKVQASLADDPDTQIRDAIAAGMQAVTP